MLTDNTARAHEDNGPSFMECGQNKSGEDNYSRTQALPRASERRNSTTGYGDETRELRQMQIFAA